MVASALHYSHQQYDIYFIFYFDIRTYDSSQGEFDK